MNRVLSSFAFLCCFMVAEAQQMDTILLFDYYYKRHATWGKGNRFMANFGMTVYLNKTDSVHLAANDSSPGLKLYKFKYLIAMPGRIRIEGIRIIKPAAMVDTIHIKSEKRFNSKTYKLDTLFRLDSNLPRPFIFWQPLREKEYVPVCNFCPTHFELSNEEFSYKGNYKNAGIINKLNAAIRYEYYLPEGKLVKLW
jgi:hypothetical protein